MDCLRQAYPRLSDGELTVALENADWDIIDALELLQISHGDPGDGMAHRGSTRLIDRKLGG